MTAITAGWHDFFTVQAGASASLTGLVFVAVSLNLRRILEYPHLPLRTVEALITLLSVLAVSMFGLVPAEPPLIYGIEIGAVGLCVWAVKTAMLVAMFRAGAVRYRPLLRILTNQFPPLPFILAGI